MDDKKEKYKLLSSALIPFTIVAIMWAVKIAEIIVGSSFGFLGVAPLTAKGLLGIFLMPFLHGGWQHLMANSVPMLVLGTALYYFYRPIANRVMLLTYLVTGLLTWCGAREGIHIGASAMIYGLNFFLIISGFIRRNSKLIAISLIMIFLYGSFIWGVFPAFTEPRHISWEGHLSGLATGILLAVFYRHEGPQREVKVWDEEEESSDEDDIDGSNGDKPYWDVPQPDKDELTVKYHFKK